jgi:hypothetical protein
MTVKVTTGDTQPLLTLTLFKQPGGDDVPNNRLDLTDATSIVWHIKRGTTDVTKTATIADDPTTGVTTVQWDGDASITPANWSVRAVITWNDATVETTTDHNVLEVLAAA